MNEFIYTTEYKGVPVKLHWSILLTLISGIYFQSQSYITMILAFFAVIIIILVHEIGHYYMANKYNYDVYEIVIHYLGGYCTHEGTYYQYEDSMISWGGVFAQGILLISALIFLGILSLLQINNLFLIDSLIIGMFIHYNFFLMIFNLLPVPGFDGDSAWKIIRYLPIDRIIPKKKSRKIVSKKKPVKKKSDTSIIKKTEVKQVAEKLINDVINQVKEKQK